MNHSVVCSIRNYSDALISIDLLQQQGIPAYLKEGTQTSLYVPMPSPWQGWCYNICVSSNRAESAAALLADFSPAASPNDSPSAVAGTMPLHVADNLKAKLFWRVFFAVLFLVMGWEILQGLGRGVHLLLAWYSAL